MTFVLSCIYFYLPVALANIGAVISKFIPLFKDIIVPIDFKKSIKGVRIIGDHKTIGGFIFGVLFGTLAGVIKYTLLDKYFHDYHLLNLTFVENTLLYFILSFSALTGDVIKSIAKRFFNIAPHKAWIPFDEIDHSVLSMLVAVPFYGLSLGSAFTIIVVFFFLHFVSNIIGYLLNIKSVPY